MPRLPRRRTLVAAAISVAAVAAGLAVLPIANAATDAGADPGDVVWTAPEAKAETRGQAETEAKAETRGKAEIAGKAKTRDKAEVKAGALAAPAGSPVAVNGQLRVCGVNLCDAGGDPIQLRGMSSHGIQFFPDCLNPDSLDALRNDWLADFVRISMYVQEGGFETDPAGFTSRVNEAVETATALGLYAIIDFHILTPGDPTFNLGRARTFFADVAAAHADKPNVIYEIANEPNGVRWDAIKSYAEQVIPVIRSADPDGVVLVGTRGFSSLGLTDGSDETEIIDDPVEADNIMYTFHFYAASHGADRRAVVERAAARLPLFVSEFGTQTFTGDGANDLASATAWLDLLKRLKVGYAMWSFSDGRESNSVFRPGTCQGTEYAGTEILTEAGAFIRDRIRTGASAG